MPRTTRSDRRCCLTPPNLPGWHYLPLSKRLEEITGVKVALENDANLAALAEALVGAGAGKHFVQFLTISTGVGAGLCVNGKIYHGAKGFGQEVANSIVWRDGPSQGDLKKDPLNPLQVEQRSQNVQMMQASVRLMQEKSMKQRKQEMKLPKRSWKIRMNICLIS